MVVHLVLNVHDLKAVNLVVVVDPVALVDLVVALVGLD